MPKKPKPKLHVVPPPPSAAKERANQREARRSWVSGFLKLAEHPGAPILHRELAAEIAELRMRLDALRDAHPRECCADAECMVCGVLECPECEPLHFHHDGCPACSMEDA